MTATANQRQWAEVVGMTLRRKQRRTLVRLDIAIIAAGEQRDIDPYAKPFKPGDLGIKATRYGSFSDWCSRSATKSGKYIPQVYLALAANRVSDRKPTHYLLLPPEERVH